MDFRGSASSRMLDGGGLLKRPAAAARPFHTPAASEIARTCPGREWVLAIEEEFSMGVRKNWSI
jgi:hypothetical protein